MGPGVNRRDVVDVLLTALLFAALSSAPLSKLVPGIDSYPSIARLVVLGIACGILKALAIRAFG